MLDYRGVTSNIIIYDASIHQYLPFEQEKGHTDLRKLIHNPKQVDQVVLSSASHSSASHHELGTSSAWVLLLLTSRYFWQICAIQATPGNKKLANFSGSCVWKKTIHPQRNIWVFPKIVGKPPKTDGENKGKPS